ncbi:hypothetical protein SDC9_203632 [bioreactor metagenome]|uniref:Uncharacterized protein n=1 Tax=bioreactor metagenome TaxID=1076179 RepID=A0A645IX14_9ZZZZ
MLKQVGCVAIDFAPSKERTVLELIPVIVHQKHVLDQIHTKHNAALMPIFRNMRDAAFEHIERLCIGQILSVDANLPGSDLCQPRDTVCKFALSVAVHAADA